MNGIGASYYDGTFWFETSKTSRKGRNLARDPRCALVYRMTISRAMVLATVEPGGATTFTFSLARAPGPSG